MKRIIAIVLAAMMLVAAFAGCGGTKNADLSGILTEINTKYDLSLTEIDTTDKLNKYYGINPEDVKQFAAETNQNNNAAIEIVLVEAVDSDAAARVETALTTRFNSIVQQYSSYTPEKLDMVKACKVTKDGNFVSMIVADDAAGMSEVYNSSIK